MSYASIEAIKAETRRQRAERHSARVAETMESLNLPEEVRAVASITSDEWGFVLIKIPGHRTIEAYGAKGVPPLWSVGHDEFRTLGDALIAAEKRPPQQKRPGFLSRLFGGAQ